ncbi:helix-turn-helix domain-containing protein [Paraburkholderia silviterrae]|uniref:Helix-turn-helix domain-containing protein n=1 Tax=Paraburkholderia silviterrae TaxID=2528715 RepID=A0A4V6PJ56_9BURK|nr:helix-turn-helix transcriptional regulator [Paraburkholderia silviterrae]TDG24661.1 helix-turn-helix domain-containing protein [Paraburkholderia silviterrae]
MAKSNEEFAAKIKEKAAIWGAIRKLDPMLQLKTCMRNNNLRNIDIAERLCVSEANISRILKGRGNVTLHTLYMLADAAETELVISIKGSDSGIIESSGTDEDRGELFTIGEDRDDASDVMAFSLSPGNVIPFPRAKQTDRDGVIGSFGGIESELCVAFG